MPTPSRPRQWMLPRLLLASLRHRPGYLLTVACAAAAAGAALAASGGLASRLSAALDAPDAFGPNVLVRPEPGGAAALPLADAARLRAIPGVAAVVPWAELAWVGRDPTVLAGDPGRGEQERLVLATEPAAIALHRGWTVDGRWPGGDEVLAGVALGAPVGATVATPRGPRRVSGLLRTGEALDGALLLDLASLAQPASPPIARFELRVDPPRVEAIAAAVESTVAGTEARPLQRVGTARARLATRLGWLLAAIATLTAALALGTVAAASLAQVESRRAELGLLFALGFTRGWVSRLLGLELLLPGVVAALLGIAVGEAIARGFATRLLEGAAPAGSAWGAALALVGTVVVLLAAAVATGRRLEAVRAAAALGGR